MKRRWLWPLILIAPMGLGCGVDDSERMAVRGTIRVRGQLLASGTVVFVPDLDRGTPNELAIGQIKTDGTYQLETDTGRGVAPGWYRITIVAAPTALGLALPDKYRDPRRSGLEREVRRGQENLIDFALE
jgi:hypothetical protein